MLLVYITGLKEVVTKLVLIKNNSRGIVFKGAHFLELQ